MSNCFPDMLCPDPKCVGSMKLSLSYYEEFDELRCSVCKKLWVIHLELVPEDLNKEEQCKSEDIG